jgi:hypothetical protein
VVNEAAKAVVDNFDFILAASVSSLPSKSTPRRRSEGSNWPVPSPRVLTKHARPPEFFIALTSHTLLAGSPQADHRDPFNWLLAAQAGWKCSHG